MVEASNAVRLDLWLWAARFYKTRTLAKQAIEAGRVGVDGQHAKPSRLLKSGESLSVRRGDESYVITVMGLASKRGSATLAQQLYVESDESKSARETLRLKRIAERDGYLAPEHKPDKRARRLIRALGDIDAL